MILRMPIARMVDIHRRQACRASVGSTLPPNRWAKISLHKRPSSRRTTVQCLQVAAHAGRSPMGINERIELTASLLRAGSSGALDVCSDAAFASLENCLLTAASGTASNPGCLQRALCTSFAVRLGLGIRKALIAATSSAASIICGRVQVSDILVVSFMNTKLFKFHCCAGKIAAVNIPEAGKIGIPNGAAFRKEETVDLRSACELGLVPAISFGLCQRSSCGWDVGDPTHPRERQTTRPGRARACIGCSTPHPPPYD